jgi:6,7-dimethyl-8-ribityllumazine synthase
MFLLELYRDQYEPANINITSTSGLAEIQHYIVEEKLIIILGLVLQGLTSHSGIVIKEVNEGVMKKRSSGDSLVVNGAIVLKSLKTVANKVLYHHQYLSFVFCEVFLSGMSK